jgi:hypothetical protein
VTAKIPSSLFADVHDAGQDLGRFRVLDTGRLRHRAGLKVLPHRVQAEAIFFHANIECFDEIHARLSLAAAD